MVLVENSFQVMEIRMDEMAESGYKIHSFHVIEAGAGYMYYALMVRYES